MATTSALWRSVMRKQFRSLYGRDHMQLLRWQAKRTKPKKEFLFVVRQGDMQYFVIVES